MLQWLYAQEDSDNGPSSWEPFIDSNDHNDGYSERQIRHAAEHLYENQLTKAFRSFGESTAGSDQS
jgi:hypothetical protein